MSSIVRNFSNPIQTSLLPDIFDPFSVRDMFDLDTVFQGVKTPYPTDIYGITKNNTDDSEIETYVIEVALAGIGKDHISVSVDKDALNITIEVSTVSKNARYYRKGISHKNATMTFGISNIDVNKIKTTYVDGILKVELPVKTKVETKKLLTIE